MSIDPHEDWIRAQLNKKSCVSDYARPGSAGGWHFLTGTEQQIQQVAKAVGFNYKWVASAGQFSHPAGIILCTPEGKISRYLYGVQFDQTTLRLSLVEASEGKIGTAGDHFLLTCFLLIRFCIKSRHRENAATPHEPAAGHSTALELTWTIIPTILVLVIFYYGFRGFINMMVEPPNSYEVVVNGRTWAWSFTYEGRYVSDDGKLHIPVNTPIRFVLSSNDVIHSLFMPTFRVKKDVVPGRYNRFWVEAT